MHGYLSIEKRTVPWSKADADAYLAAAAVGLLAGIVVAYARTPVHLPGHKVLWWMAPVLATRIVNRARAGASVGALATVVTTMLLGGRLAGGVVMMPLVVLAGVMLDVVAGIVRRWNPSRWRGVLLFGGAGAAGNLICFIKRILEPMGAFFSTGNMRDMLAAAAYYALFGFLAGLLGAAAGYAILELHSRKLKN